MRNAREAIVHVIGDAIVACTLHWRRCPAGVALKRGRCVAVGHRFPAFAVGDEERVRPHRNSQQTQRKLWMQAFLLDGHQTVVEDTSRVHYEHSELVNFENIESEWPLFLLPLSECAV